MCVPKLVATCGVEHTRIIDYESTSRYSYSLKLKVQSYSTWCPYWYVLVGIRKTARCITPGIAWKWWNDRRITVNTRTLLEAILCTLNFLRERLIYNGVGKSWHLFFGSRAIKTLRLEEYFGISPSFLIYEKCIIIQYLWVRSWPFLLYLSVFL